MQQLALSDDIHRLVVLGDPHGDLEGVEQIYELESLGGTLFCCVGDVVGYADGPTSSRLCHFFMERGVPTVEGNHEEWVDGDGRLRLVEDASADRQLSAEAFGWIRSLPEIIRFTREDDATLAVLSHSIRDPEWEWIDVSNVESFVRGLGSPSVVVSGHSHRAKFLKLVSEAEPERESFDYRATETIETAIPMAGSLVIDSGSVARPEATELVGRVVPHDGAGYGTYAVVDFAARTASLRRLVKIAA